MAKQTSDKLAEVAARILRGGKYNEADVKALAACVLAQDETAGKRKPSRSRSRLPSR